MPAPLKAGTNEPITTPTQGAAANPAIALWLQSTRPAGRGGELGSLAAVAFSDTTMITTRFSTPVDAEAISVCVDAVARERRYLGNTSGFSAEQTRSFIGSLWDNGGIQIVVVADAKIVGWCDVTPVPFEGMNHVGRLGMGLLPSFRGQGLGRRLLREALSEVFAKALKRVELEVFASNKIGVGLYESEGFVIEGRKRLGRFLDGDEDDILIMGCLRDEWLRSTSQQAGCRRRRDRVSVDNPTPSARRA